MFVTELSSHLSYTTNTMPIKDRLAELQARAKRSIIREESIDTSLTDSKNDEANSHNEQQTTALANLYNNCEKVSVAIFMTFKL